MRIGLIAGTAGRTEELRRFLETLAAQRYEEWELIVADQNADDRLGSVLKRFGRLPLVRLRCRPGLCAARNAALARMRRKPPEIVGFPDDDCGYPPDFLERVAGFFRAHPEADGLSGRAVDENGRENARFDRKAGWIRPVNAWERVVAVGLFLRWEAVQRTGEFDESIGPGAGTPWAAGDEVEYVLRALSTGARIFYDPTMAARHPDPLRHGYGAAAGRAYGYGAGIGRVWRRHRMPIWRVAYYLLRPFGGSLLALAAGRRGEARYHWNAFRGRCAGYLARS